MKKILFGTTALATVGLLAGIAGDDAAAAERIKLDLSGYSQFWLVGLDQDFEDTGTDRLTRGVGLHNSSIDFKQNAEICFIGQTTLDNGITVGVNVQLEANGEVGGGDGVIDESFLFVQSDRFGQLILGADDSVSDKFHVQAPNGGFSIDGDGDVNTNQFFLDTLGARGVADDTTPEFTSDDTKISYITPRYFGFQAGVSYTPQDTGSGQRSPNYKVNGDYHDAVSAALNYRNVFANGFGVAVSGGLEWANTPAGTSTLTNSAADPDAVFDKSVFAWGAGAQFSYAGFTLGGGYRKIDGPTNFGTPGANTPAGLREATDGQGFDVENWSVGGSYETGPYKVGVEYVNTEAPGVNTAGTDDVERQVLGVSGTYLLGPGIRLIGGFFWFDQEAEGTRDGNGDLIGCGAPVNNRPDPALAFAGTCEQSDSDGWGGVVGLTTSF